MPKDCLFFLRPRFPGIRHAEIPKGHPPNWRLIVNFFQLTVQIFNVLFVLQKRVRLKKHLSVRVILIAKLWRE